MLTLDKLKATPPNTTFDGGTIMDGPNGLHMTNTEQELRWVAVRGTIHDWAIYIGRGNQSDLYIKDHGDKLYNPLKIRHLVLCDDEAFNMYWY